jgi:DNA-binding transcriptional MocR family regulator
MSDGNASHRVAQALREEVARSAPGTRLPSVRELMGRHGAGPVTVQRAVARLAEEGLVEPRPGRGTFVAAPPPGRDGEAVGTSRAPDLAWQAVALGDGAPDADALHRHLARGGADALSLTVGYPDESLQPVGLLAQAMGRAARRPGSWSWVPTEGLERLRAWFALQAGGHVRAADVVVTPGAQAGLATALRVLAEPGAPVLLESPTYLGAIAAARAAGLRTVPVPVDAEGIRPDLLADALRRTGARLVVCQPLFANPHGAVLAPERRAAVLEAVGRAGAFLVEDDYARDLALDGEPQPPLVAEDEDGHVVHLRSLTKATAPGLRVAALIARGPAGARLRAARVVDDFFVAGPMQEAALEVVSPPPSAATGAAWRRCCASAATCSPPPCGARCRRRGSPSRPAG